MKCTEYLTYSAPEGEIVFPVARVKGARPGPRVVITAGVHGCEYPGVAAAIRLFQKLEPAALAGEVVIVPIVSMQAFEQRHMFTSPADGLNPNRVFPGRADGSYTEILAYHLLHDVIAGADYHLDLHSGDMVEALEPFAIYHGGAGEEIDRKSEELAVYYGLPNRVQTRAGGSWPDDGTTYANAARIGVPSAIVEAGGVGQMESEYVEMHLKGLINVLRSVGCLEGEAIRPDSVKFSDFVWLYTPVKGMFYRSVSVGETVVEGQIVGRMEDYFGASLQDIVSPAGGRILFLTTSPAMAEKGLLMGIGVV